MSFPANLSQLSENATRMLLEWDGTQATRDAQYCLKRELIIMHIWCRIRSDFFKHLCLVFKKEPRSKLRWRVHEMLAKWILAQKAREDETVCATEKKTIEGTVVFTHTSTYRESYEEYPSKCIKRDEAASCIQDARMPQPQNHTDETPESFFPRFVDTYDHQLVRDLTILLDCTQAHEIQKVKDFVHQFDINLRCREAWSRIRGSINMVQIQKLEVHRGEESSATMGQRQIKGKVRTVHVVHTCPQVIQKPQTTTISVPESSYEKLQGAFMARSDETTVSRNDALLRIAVVLIRYLTTLASGSVQLCANVSMKHNLVAKGYHVIDLCASPINAFVALDPPLSTNDKSPPSVSANFASFFFCSAFPDVDHHFGSIGSVLAPTVGETLVHMLTKFVGVRKWIFTLDIPYDEDFAELLFGRNFLRDRILKPIEESLGLRDPARDIHFISVIPYWWDLRFDAVPTTGGQLRSLVPCYQQKGHTVPCTWITTMASLPNVIGHIYVPKREYVYYTSELNEEIADVVDTEILLIQACPQIAAKDREQERGEVQKWGSSVLQIYLDKYSSSVPS